MRYIAFGLFVLCVGVSSLAVAASDDCIQGTKKEIDYPNPALGSFFNLRNEATIRGSDAQGIWVTDCPVPVAMAEMEIDKTKVCEHANKMPKSMTMSIALDNDVFTMTLNYPDDTGSEQKFSTELSPRRSYERFGSKILYMESIDRWRYEKNAYDIFVYFRHDADSDSTSRYKAYKTFRIEFFDLKDEDCRDSEAPYVAGVIKVPRSIPFGDGAEIPINDFYEWIEKNNNAKAPSKKKYRDAKTSFENMLRIQKPPLVALPPAPTAIMESQVGDGSEPRRQ